MLRHTTRLCVPRFEIPSPCLGPYLAVTKEQANVHESRVSALGLLAFGERLTRNAAYQENVAADQKRPTHVAFIAKCP